VLELHARIGLARCCFERDEHAPDRHGHLSRREARHRHLIQQGSEQMLVLPVEPADVHGRAGERTRQARAAKAATDHDHLA
jgi:hypothetical protein